jgi:hypothetical protein
MSKQLTLNNIVIESRESDNFINATQLCKAGGKRFKNWTCLDQTNLLMEELKNRLKCEGKILPSHEIKVIDVKRGNSKNFSQGSWIHPDLAVQLAQWISPAFSIQVSRWIRELFITGTVSIDSQKTDEELKNLQDQLHQRDTQIKKLETRQLKLESFVKNIQMLEKNQIFYLATTKNHASQSRFEYGGVKASKDLRGRLATYNTGRAEGDLYYYCNIFNCNNYKVIEDRIGSILYQFKDKMNSSKEMLHLRYNLLAEITDFICNNYDREVEYINKRCQHFLNNTIEGDDIIPPEIDLRDRMEISIKKNGKSTNNKKIDITGWDDQKIDQTITNIINLCAVEKKKTHYDFITQKNLVALELTWGLITPYLDTYYGITKTDWRARFKDLLNKESPKKLRIKGIKWI